MSIVFMLVFQFSSKFGRISGQANGNLMRRIATKRRDYFWDSDSPWAFDLSVVSRVIGSAFFGIFWFAWLVGPIASKAGNALPPISQLKLLITTILGALAIFGLFRLRRLVPHVDSRNHWLLLALCFCSWQWAVATGFLARPPFPSWARVIADLVFIGLCLSGFIAAEQISLRLPQRGRDLVQVLLLVPLLFLLYELFLLQSGLSSVLVAFLLYGAARIQVAGRIRWRGSKKALRPGPNTPKLPCADQTGRVIPVISDTHLGPQAADETNKKLERILAALSSMGDRGPCLFTGDLTNEGRQSEWVEWERIVKKHIAGPVLLLPGNHDLLFGRATTMTRSARFLLAAYRMLPAETRCYGDDGKTTTPQKVLKPVLNWLEVPAFI